MYQREMKIWQKHLDFILLDALCFQVAYVAAYIFRHGFFFPYSDFRYRNLGVILFLVQICAGFFMENYKNILRRSFIDELKKTILLITVVILVIFAYLFVTKTAFIFSRAVLLQLWMFGVGLIYCERIAWKSRVMNAAVSAAACFPASSGIASISVLSALISLMTAFVFAVLMKSMPKSMIAMASTAAIVNMKAFFFIWCGALTSPFLLRLPCFRQPYPLPVKG